MFFALGAATSALNLITGLGRALGNSHSGAGFNVSTGQASSSPSPASTASASVPGGGLSAETCSALLQELGKQPQAAGLQPGTNPLKNLFSTLDADGDGAISKSEFEGELGAGGTNVAAADSVFGKLDANGDGKVTLDEMQAALKGHGRHHGAAAAPQGTTSQTTTAADGSTTTTISYPDGSKVTMTTPAASAAGASAFNTYNVLERLISRQAASVSAVGSSVSVSA